MVKKIELWIIYTYAMLVTLACGVNSEEVDVTQFSSSNAIFEEYKDSFVADAVNYGDLNYAFEVASININFYDDYFVGENQFAVGACVYSLPLRKYKEIYIKQAAWKSFDDETKKYLIYHELGHCVLNKTHVEDENSIMNATIYANQINEESYINFFTL